MAAATAYHPPTRAHTLLVREPTAPLAAADAVTICAPAAFAAAPVVAMACTCPAADIFASAFIFRYAARISASIRAEVSAYFIWIFMQDSVMAFSFSASVILRAATSLAISCSSFFCAAFSIFSRRVMAASCALESASTSAAAVAADPVRPPAFAMAWSTL